MKTNRMLECYCRINATADDAAIASSIPQSACCDYPMKRVETCTQTRWLYCQASKGRLPASDCRACRHDEPNGGSHQEGLKRGAIKIDQINLKAGCSSNRQDKANEGGINAGGLQSRSTGRMESRSAPWAKHQRMGDKQAPHSRHRLPAPWGHAPHVLGWPGWNHAQLATLRPRGDHAATWPCREHFGRLRMAPVAEFARKLDGEMKSRCA